MDKQTWSYTSNEVGSGHYCSCGQELTHSEYQGKHTQDHKCKRGKDNK